jgi:hypothetical protein
MVKKAPLPVSYDSPHIVVHVFVVILVSISCATVGYFYINTVITVG